MARQTPKGLYVWDLETDKYDHTKLAANWDLIDALLDTPAKTVEILTRLPTTNNFAGRLVMLSATDGGFSAWSLMRYDGSAWRPVGPIEVLPDIPTLGNYAGRIIVLSANTVSHNAWDILSYNGATWDVVGGWWKINYGDIVGVQTGGDAYINNSAAGVVLVDRADGSKRRVYLQGGELYTELVNPPPPSGSPPPVIQPPVPPPPPPPTPYPWPYPRLRRVWPEAGVDIGPGF